MDCSPGVPATPLAHHYQDDPMGEKSKIVLIVILSAILLAYIFGFFEITFLLVMPSHENILSLLGVSAGLMWLLSFVIGYFLIHLMLGPWIFHKRGDKGFRWAYSWLNPMAVQSLLESLARKNDDSSIDGTSRLVRFSRYSLVMTVCLFIALFVISS
jgi:hypothetical protein